MRIPPIAAPAMRNRIISGIIIIAPVLFMLLNIIGIFKWQCPLHSYTGFQCCGCGMTRGIIAALHGHIKKSYCFHPFAIPLIFLWLTYTIIQFLPEQKRLKTVNSVEHFEKRTGIIFIFIALYATFGVIRLLLELITRY